MDRRQYLAVTGATLSTGFAGCLGPLGGNDDPKPQNPQIEGINVETSPSVRVTVNVRNPTDESQRRTVWIRVPDKNGNILARRSTTTSFGAGTTGPVPFIFDNIAWSGTDIDTGNVEAKLTQPGAESPF
jgi:gamma-glutamyltranspeptidase